ncbi:MAG: NAD(P)/FAD-dependent oxidoreductase [Ignavibacteriae bacterium]|nr:NAD(P)/FAD-dependent oxidoreductase [Ignavibacteriota bacterium]
MNSEGSFTPGGSYDVVVVGSGPAGSSAALILAQNGVSVILVEKASLPRYKTCGGGIVGRALKLLPFSVSQAIKHYCYTAHLNLVDANLSFSSSRQEPIVAMTMRDNFDSLLLFATRDAGAIVKSECEVVDIQQQPGSVKLVTTLGTIQAKFIIAGDGALSTVARKAGWRETRKLMPAVEYEVFVQENELRRCHHTARFDFGIVPHGYAWMFPKKEHLSIGVLTTRKNSANLHHVVKNYLKLLGIVRIPRIEKHGFVIPMGLRKDGFARNRVLLVGDAAGFVDPVTGEGITFAILSGQLAARAVIEGNFDEQSVRQNYLTTLQERILPELRIASFLSNFLYHPQSRNWLFRRYGRKFADAVTDVMMGEKTYKHIVSTPRSYLQLIGV